MLNHITIMGRLTRDPELRYTGNETPVCSFTLAVDRDFADKQSGEKQTDFIDCVAWRQTAEFVSKYFSKGSMAVVSGRLQIRDWQDNDGNKRRSAEVVAEHIYFGEAKKSAEGRSEGSGGYHSEPQRASTARPYNQHGSYQPVSQQTGFAEIYPDEYDDGPLPF